LTADNRPRRIVLLSTSGVYGDRGGARVDETTPPSPGTDRGRRRLDAEQRLRRFGEAHGVETIILRVGGIYGPGRLPEKRLREGVPMVPPEQAPVTNRIHVDDLARICVAAARRGRDGEIYNVSDGTAGNMTDYFDAVADFLGLPRPPRIDRAEAERTLSPGMVSYLQESRHLDNRKMREELGVTLRYPDLASGLAACVETATETGRPRSMNRVSSLSSMARPAAAASPVGDGVADPATACDGTPSGAGGVDVFLSPVCFRRASMARMSRSSASSRATITSDIRCSSRNFSRACSRRFSCLPLPSNSRAMKFPLSRLNRRSKIS